MIVKPWSVYELRVAAGIEGGLGSYLAATSVPPDTLRRLAVARTDELQRALLAHGTPATQLRLEAPSTTDDPSIEFRFGTADP